MHSIRMLGIWNEIDVIILVLYTSQVSVLESASSGAAQGAAATTAMKASAGRASYVNQSQLKQPDPGAHAISIIFKAILDAAQ